MLALIIQLLSGALGGNVAGKFMPNSSLGTLGNSIAGILGGGVGGQLLGMLSPAIGQAAAVVILTWQVYSVQLPAVA